MINLTLHPNMFCLLKDLSCYEQCFENIFGSSILHPICDLFGRIIIKSPNSLRKNSYNNLLTKLLYTQYYLPITVASKPLESS